MRESELTCWDSHCYFYRSSRVKTLRLSIRVTGFFGVDR